MSFDLNVRIDVFQTVARRSYFRTADVARALLEKFAQITEVRVKVEKPKPDGLEALAEAVELTIARGPRS